MADPGGGSDDEGATPTLRQQLETASTAYYAAQSTLTASVARQEELQQQLGVVQARLATLTDEVAASATGRYEGGRVRLLTPFLLTEAGNAEVLDAAALTEYLVWRDDAQLRELHLAQQQADQQRQLIDAEVARQKVQLTALDQQKRAAEDALASVGGMVSTGFTGAVPAAQPAPRNPDGSWPVETCSVDDPTTTGCITPRMYHALTEARLAGFTHYVSCHRASGEGEHPKGRACDFAAAQDGFGGTATGADRVYGNRLAAWCIKNADALGVLYVIWFHQIWLPGIGWRSYAGNGTPSGDHTNHVHLSVL
jgi:hypothetical protein